jgi:hypothetical protein
MNGVAACTLLDKGANRFCILRLYIGNTNNPNISSGVTFGVWDWIGGNYRLHDMRGNTGGWTYSYETLTLGGESVVGGRPNTPGTMTVFAILSNVPKNFLDIGPHNTARGVCQHPDHIVVDWSIWFRAS